VLQFDGRLVPDSLKNRLAVFGLFDAECKGIISETGSVKTEIQS
jgi:hypothetical protein